MALKKIHASPYMMKVAEESPLEYKLIVQAKLQHQHLLQEEVKASMKKQMDDDTTLSEMQEIKNYIFGLREYSRLLGLHAGCVHPTELRCQIGSEFAYCNCCANTLYIPNKNKNKSKL